MKEMIIQLFEFLSSLGYLGIALGLMAEVIPSEIVLSYGGYLVASGKIHFAGALLAGVAGGTAAQLFLYWLGYFGGRPVLERYGKYLLIKGSHLDAAENWFNRYGTGVIFTARFIPVVRHAISIPAGIAKMPLRTFFLYTVAAIIPWTVLFLLMGMELGSHWNEVKDYAKPYLAPIIVTAALLLAGYIAVKARKKD